MAVFMGLWDEARKKCLLGLSCWLAAGQEQISEEAEKSEKGKRWLYIKPLE